MTYKSDFYCSILKKVASPLSISLFLNLLALFFLQLILSRDLSFPIGHSPQRQRQRIIIKKSRKKIAKEIRTVGVKNGNKRNSFLIRRGKKKYLPKDKNQVKAEKLAPQNNPGKDFKLLRPQLKTLLPSSRPGRLEFTVNNVKAQLNHSQVQIQENILKQLATNPSNRKALEGKGFNLQLEAPEGISIDELNSIEKIFYSFQKRIFKKYLNSFLSTYRQDLLSHPQLKKEMRTNKHRLNGRVTFDSHGNIILIKILKSSLSDEIHNLFESTLKKMKSLPNPPKDLVNKDGTFTVYYTLYIN